MLVDSHCHLDMLNPRVDETVRAAQADGVGHLLCVGVDLATYPRMRELVEPYPNVSVSVGLHPMYKTGDEPTEAGILEHADDPKVVAIGEMGLDYSTDDPGHEHQQARFGMQVRAARRAGKPIIVHTRGAPADTERVLRENGADEVGGVIHCFTEDWQSARAFMDLGFHISFSGIVTFRNAGPLREVARKIPADRLLIETDSPYLAPVPHRGSENRPSWVRRVAECLAEERGESFEAIAECTTENFFRCFPEARK